MLAKYTSSRLLAALALASVALFASFGTDSKAQGICDESAESAFVVRPRC
jgi:hypothetical protein